MYRRILSVLGANLFGQIITIIIQVISVPLFLHFWGTKLYGEWIILTALPSYLIVSGTGIGYVAGNTMQKNIASNQINNALSAFQSAWIVTLGLSLLLLLIIIPTVLYLPLLKWLNIVYVLPHSAILTLIIFTFYISLSLQTELFNGVYRANQKFARGIMILNILRLIEFIGTVSIIIAGGKFVAVSITLLTARIFGIIWILRDLRNISWIRFGVKHSTTTLIKSELVSTLSFLGFPLGHACMIQGMTTVIGIRLGPGAVVIFSAVRTMTGFIKQFASSIYYSIWPELTNTLSTGNFKIAKNIHRNAFQFTLLFALLTSLGLYMLGAWIFNIWTNGKLKFENTFFLLMLVSTIPNTLWMMSSYVSISINKHSSIAIFYSSLAFSSMIICYILIPHFGLAAAPMSILFCDINTFLFVMKKSFIIVQEKISEFSLFIISNNPLRKIINKRFS